MIRQRYVFRISVRWKEGSDSFGLGGGDNHHLATGPWAILKLLPRRFVEAETGSKRSFVLNTTPLLFVVIFARIC